MKRGLTLLSALMIVTAVLGLLIATGTVLRFELKSSSSTKSASLGFYAAEAGLNLRANMLREIFVGFNVPTGFPPNSSNPCAPNNMGSGDYACQVSVINGRRVVTYVSPEPNNPRLMTIPQGELYQGLTAQEYTYTVYSRSFNQANNALEAHLELKIRSRLVPLFQFAAFYNKDLEILPGPTMYLAGPVHTNGNLYLNSENVLTINGQVTTAGRLFRGRKNLNACLSNSVRIHDPVNPVHLVPNCPNRTEVIQSQVSNWNNMIRIGVQPLNVPDPGILSPSSNGIYWSRADLRVVLNANTNQFEIRDSGNQLMQNPTTIFRTNSRCQNSARIRNFNNRRERMISDTVTTPPDRFSSTPGRTITLLDVDLTELLNCLFETNWLGLNKALNETSDGGLVFFFTVIGPGSNPVDANANGLPDQPSPYGVRIRNAGTIRATSTGNPPRPRGITIVSDQAVYIWGDFNANNWIPAAILSDSINILSRNWTDSKDGLQLDQCNYADRIASNTMIQAAFLSGTDVTGLVEGVGGHNIDIYNGGLENYPRFHEDWNGYTLTYRGSFVSLNKPLKVRGFWASQCYRPPARDWQYDTRFNDAVNLPPLTPRFVYQKQQLYLRHF
ncbi:MAG: hypothetical protein N2654_00900 [Deltaproteobacteria bacterium]|nr:hypothetical protein [Deltaproteobacteria bacterium]